MKTCLYELLYKYISLFIRANTSLVEISPHHGRLVELFVDRRAAVYAPYSSTIELPDSVAQITSLPDIAKFKPDFLLLNGNLHYEADIQLLLQRLHAVCTAQTRVIIVYYSSLWRPLIRLATKLGLRNRTPEQNWIAHEDIDNLLTLTGFGSVRRSQHIICPVYVPLLSNFLNRYLAPLPFFRLFTLVNILVARPLIQEPRTAVPSVSVVVAARNESGTIESLIQRIPRMGPDDELIFVEGHSTDSTWQVIREMTQKYNSTNTILAAQQSGKGKGDAVRMGFDMASKDILMILDADLSVMPEDLPKFYRALVEDKGEFINGSRLVYPMDAKAMRFWNILGNKFFAIAFSFVIGQRFKDTLCGTKVLTRANYLKIAANRSYFGDFDPFGDFDLLFGAGSLGMKIVELPVHYKERIYGDTNIQRWRHGFLLLRMLIFAARKMKFL
jgi:hypothetical protein